MSESLSLGGAGAMTRDRTHTLFGQTMGYVAVTTGFFALGAYLGRNLAQGWAIVWFIVAFACLIAMNFTVRRSKGLSAVLLWFSFSSLERDTQTVADFLDRLLADASQGDQPSARLDRRVPSPPAPGSAPGGPQGR